MSKPNLNADANVLRIKPFFYIHVTDTNSNVSRVEIGPKTFTKSEHERVVFGPEEMIKIPPRSFVKIKNPVLRDAHKHILLDKHGNCRLRYGDEEIRFEQEPFPLYPGETLVGKVQPLLLVKPDSALRLKAIRDFKDGEYDRVSGDEWLFEGPGTYIPRVEEIIVEVIQAKLVNYNQALRLRARRETKDRAGQKRKAGEEWLHREEGAYILGVDEELVETVQAHILSETKAVHLRAKRSFTDVYGVNRNAGEEWLVTLQMSESHIPDIYEEFVGLVEITVLSKRQFCYVLDPFQNGKQQLGQKELRTGPQVFFLLPGERLEGGIQNVLVLGEQEALLFRARSIFKDGETIRQPGDKWMIYGPSDFVPPVEVEIIERRKTIPLDENEGIYVRDTKSGSVRAVCGHSYMLQPHEELWEKDLPQTVEDILQATQLVSGKRDKSRVVTYRVPHNKAVQIHDYKENRSRVVFGPDLILLGPEEQFTILSLSGSKPKKPHVVKDIALQLGPEFSTDIVKVETVDHARLAIQLSYNWKFERTYIDASGKEVPVDGSKYFSVPDFIGDLCKDIASKIRCSVATCYFEHFHRHSAKVIRQACFSTDSSGKVLPRIYYPENFVCVTNIDIQSVEPIDHRTRDLLQKSVQLAIEITTNSQEANAKHAALKLEQEAKGRLERQKISDEANAERAKKELLRLQALSSTVEISGQSTAEAAAKAKAAEIEDTAAVQQTKLRVKAQRLLTDAQLDALTKKQNAEIEHTKELNILEIEKTKTLAEIESKKFSDIVECIGAGTLKSIAQAGPELQAKLLQGLGLKSFMITDGTSPVNLFNTAQGLVGKKQNHSNVSDLNVDDL